MIFRAHKLLPILSLLALLPGANSAASQPLKKYLQKPKLIVVVVIDQFRADYLSRFESRFAPAQDKAKKTLGGFKFLMENGAYYPLAEYDVLQSMTCPGHAMIMTGSHPNMNGIPVNEWYDRKAQKMQYCAEDPQFEYSPHNLKTTTFTDELKNTGAKSKVITLALKDRSAIMLGGHRADLALWMDYKSFAWRTSTYYAKDLPNWTKILNAKVKAIGNAEMTWTSSVKPTGLSEDSPAIFEKKYLPFSKNGLSQNFGIEVALDAAESAVFGENLGHGSATDVLAISLSNHDMLGHGFGPNSRELEELTVFEDQKLSHFFTILQRHMGGSLKDVAIILTADHGIPPTIEYSTKAKIDSGKLDYLELYKAINQRLDKKFGTPKNKEWIAASRYFHFYLNPATLDEKSLSSKQVEDEVKAALEEQHGVFYVATKSDLKAGIYPPGALGDQLKKQYIADKSGDLILLPRPFYMEKDDNLVTHMTGFSYDKTVPLILFGSAFKSGVYAEPAKVIDLAPTLSFLMGIVPPATSEGRVLSEIF